MIVWKVPEQRIIEVGEKLGAFPQVSHCYQRPVYPDWPYNVFSMIHCKSQEEASDVAKQIQNQINVDEYKILFSAKEFKKTRVEYFVEQNFSLEETMGGSPVKFEEVLSSFHKYDVIFVATTAFVSSSIILILFSSFSFSICNAFFSILSLLENQYF